VLDLLFLKVYPPNWGSREKFKFYANGDIGPKEALPHINDKNQRVSSGTSSMKGRTKDS
jgi:hypothetical protein